MLGDRKLRAGGPGLTECDRPGIWLARAFPPFGGDGWPARARPACVPAGLSCAGVDDLPGDGGSAAHPPLYGKPTGISLRHVATALWTWGVCGLRPAGIGKRTPPPANTGSGKSGTPWVLMHCAARR